MLPLPETLNEALSKSVHMLMPELPAMLAFAFLRQLGEIYNVREFFLGFSLNVQFFEEEAFTQRVLFTTATDK